MEEIHEKCTKENNSYPIHKDTDGSFHIDSCDSHGGCVAANNIKYCPYCGNPLDNK